MRLKYLAIFTALLIAAPVLPAAQAALPDAGQAQTDRSVVILSVVVEADGSISNATIARSSGDGALDWAAIDHVREIKVQPKTVDGVPVRSQKIIAVAVKPRDDQAAPAAHSTIEFPTYYDI
jgi:TonB family protein